MTKSLLCTSVLAGGLLLLAPDVRAITPEGIQLGPTLLFPALAATGSHDDNIGQASANPQSGWVTSIAPSLRVTLPARRYFLNVEGGLDFRDYHDVARENGTDWFVGAAVGADFPGGLSFKIADKHTERSLIATQEFAGEDNAVNMLTATVAYAIRDALRTELSGKRTAIAFDVSTRRERVETTAQAGLYWKFRPAVSGLLEGAYTTFDYDSNTAQSGSATQAALGLSWDATSRSTGHVKAGFMWKRYDEQDPSLGTENASLYTYSAGVRHSFTQRTMLAAELLRGSQESDFPANPYFIRTGLDASLSQRLTTKLYGRLGVRYARDEYPNTASYDNPYDGDSELDSGVRTETTLAGNVALGFDVTRWLTLELAYGVEQRDSNFDTFDFDATRVSLSAKAAF